MVTSKNRSSEKRMPRKIHAGGIASGFLATFGIQAANAQQAAPFPIDLIVVTTTRFERPSFDLPRSIDRLDSEHIHDQQPRINLSESLVRVPGIVAQNRQNYTQDLQISSRGFGARTAMVCWPVAAAMRMSALRSGSATLNGFVSVSFCTRACAEACAL